MMLMQITATAATDTRKTLLAYPCHSDDFEPIMTGATTLAEPSAMKGTRISSFSSFSKKKDGSAGPGQLIDHEVHERHGRCVVP
jgi:hypothetical protein